MYVAIDFGISNTDIAISDKNSITFHSFPSQSTKINAGILKKILDKYILDTNRYKV